jgi:hypothetical protein
MGVLTPDERNENYDGAGQSYGHPPVIQPRLNVNTEYLLQEIVKLSARVKALEERFERDDEYEREQSEY